jgi:signal transduction histidine kinase
MRAPLNAVVAITRLLSATELTSEQSEFVEIIRGGGDALLTVVSDFLDLSRLEANKLRLELADFALREVPASFLDLFVALSSLFHCR